MIIGLSGYGGAGKDSVADVLVENFGFKRYAWADTLRLAAEALDPIVYSDHIGQRDYRYNEVVDAVGYNRAKFDYPEVRVLLQRLGTEVGRELLGNNVWVDATMRRIERECSTDDDIVITDTRFKNEAHTLKDRGDGYIVRVNRTDVGPAGDHPSEVDLDDYPFDYSIDNFGTLDDLPEAVETMYKTLETSSFDLRLF